MKQGTGAFVSQPALNQQYSDDELKKIDSLTTWFIYYAPMGRFISSFGII